jgi:uroporphyrinogen-III decarboxylase
MTRREIVLTALQHETPERVPLDFGSTGQTGMNASVVYRLRNYLGLEQKPIRIVEPLQMLGKLDSELLDWMDTDVVGLFNPITLFGTPLNGKTTEWTMPDGTPVLMPGEFVHQVQPDGSVLGFPQDNPSAAPSVFMPAGGSFFDPLNRVPSMDYIDMENRNAEEDFSTNFGVFSPEAAIYFHDESIRLRSETDKAILLGFGGGGFGDAGTLPGPYELKPQGVRRFEDWMMAHYLYPEYVKAVIEAQKNVALKNLAILKTAVADRVDIINISCTDFGSQANLLMSSEHFREFYKEAFAELNGWVHENTQWKTHFHCCGSIRPIIQDFIDCGVDILNPFQWTAKNMDVQDLKDTFGKKIVFWGGGVDTQKTLPFGTAQEVRDEVKNTLAIASKGGGFVFSSIHNVLSNTSAENAYAMIESFKENR